MPPPFPLTYIQTHTGPPPPPTHTPPPLLSAPGLQTLQGTSPQVYPPYYLNWDEFSGPASTCTAAPWGDCLAETVACTGLVQCAANLGYLMCTNTCTCPVGTPTCVSGTCTSP